MVGAAIVHSVNKKHVVFAVLQGLVFGLLTFKTFEPKAETLKIVPNLKGEYVDPLEEDTYRAEIKELPNGTLLVSYEPFRDWTHYVLPVVVAIGLGILHYRNLQDQAKKEQERKEREKEEDEKYGFRPEVDYTPNEDPLYEEFLLENSNRRFVPREVLEEEFQAWQKERDDAEDS